MADGAAPQIDEESLICRLADKDETALADLLRSLGGPMRGFLAKTYGRSLDEDERDLILRYALVSIWHRASKYDSDQGSVRSWVTKIVQNAAIDFLRREKKHLNNEHQPDEGFNPFYNCPKPTDEAVVESWEITQLREIIETELTPSEREVIELDQAAGGEADLGFLSEKLGKPRQNISTLRSKAIAKMKASMATREASRQQRKKK